MKTKSRAELETENNEIRTKLLSVKEAIASEEREYSVDEQTLVDNLIENFQNNRRSIDILRIEEEESKPELDVEFLQRSAKKTERNREPWEEQRLLEKQAFFDLILNGQNGMSKFSRDFLSKRAFKKGLDMSKHTKAWTDYAERCLSEWRSFSEASLEYEWGSINPETRDQLLTPPSAGGFLVPQGFSEELEVQMKFWGGMRRVSRILTTATGNQIDWPNYDDTAAVATIVGEAAPIPEQDTVFGQKQLDAYKYTSGYVDVSWELLQDSFWNFESLLVEAFAIRFGRGTNIHFTNGNGTTQPEGITTATNNTLTLATAGAITYADIVNLKYSVDRVYRMMPNVAFMFNDDIERLLMLLSTTENMPLWTPSIREGAPDTVIGTPYEINNDMSSNLAAAQTAPVMLYGTWDKYVIRDVQPMTFIRLDELKALNGLVTFLAWSRHDGIFASAVGNTGDTSIKGIIPPAA